MARRKNRTTVDGTVGYHGVIGPERRERLGDQAAVDQTLEGARNEVGNLLNVWRGRPVRVHVVVTAEPVVTDSAGSPLRTRSQRGARTRE